MATVQLAWLQHRPQAMRTASQRIKTAASSTKVMRLSKNSLGRSQEAKQPATAATTTATLLAAASLLRHTAGIKQTSGNNSSALDNNEKNTSARIARSLSASRVIWHAMLTALYVH
jgi:hypothetical protein